MIIIQVIKWVVITIVCIFEALCSLAIILAAISILAVLLMFAAIPVIVLAPVVTPLIPLAIATALVTLTLIKLLCEVSWCRWIGIIGWALKWATFLGFLLALAYLSIGTGLIAAIYGGIVSAIMISLEKGSCRLPRMRSWP